MNKPKKVETARLVFLIISNSNVLRKTGWQDHLFLSSKVKEAIKRVKKEGLKASASIVKKEKMRYCLVLIQVFVLKLQNCFSIFL